uniref:Vignain n=1 Tax=Hevea brasiliensis TaxID=3981 RepID=A0A2K8BHZ1_HEVBR|nr:cysteine proteinase SAG12H8 [Hevea brasiliensis]AJF19712.1 cysteine proteinase [Hevea brasiliensis]
MALVCKMQHLLIAFFFILVNQATSRKLHDSSSIFERHEEWMKKYGRVYKDKVEKQRRIHIFKRNVEFIESFNAAGNKPYKLSINKFADLTSEEFKASRNGYRRNKQAILVKATPFKYKLEKERGCYSYQGSRRLCCWAFSAVGAMEGIHKITTGTLIALSEQELVDCDTKGKDEGCNGGYMEDAFKFVIKNHGITSEANYPYNGTNGTCNTKKEASHVANITSYEVVPAKSEASLMKAVANQPVSVSIDGSGLEFQFYNAGVFTGDCGTEINHGVTAVGYGTTTNGTKYWLVKNSWGSDWGEKGYIRMQRDVDDKEGLCGIALYSS